MPLVTTTALCLRKVSFSETSQVLTLLSDKLGTVGAIAKGVKRPRSSIGAPLDVMCLYNAVLYDRSRRGTLSILSQAELIDFFPLLRKRYESFAAVEQLRELLLSLEFTPADGASALLLAVRALRSMAEAGSEYYALAHFAWGLLELSGIQPTVTHCVESGREASGKVVVFFNLEEMGLLSPSHAEKRSDNVRVSAATLMALQSLSIGSAIGGRKGGRDVDGWRGAFSLLAWLVARHGGRQLKAVSPPDLTRAV